MNKDINIAIRVDPETNEQLEKLTAITVRTKSDMVRWLIREEYMRQIAVQSDRLLVKEAPASA